MLSACVVAIFSFLRCCLGMLALVLHRVRHTSADAPLLFFDAVRGDACEGVDHLVFTTFDCTGSASMSFISCRVSG